MKTEVDNYRGWEIFFDTESEKFTAYSNEHDKDIEKGSYSTIKKSIDDFIKENDVFKPFMIEPTPSYRIYNRKETHFKIIGVRKDGRFIYEDKDGKKHQLSEYHEKDYMVVDPANVPVLKRYDELKAYAEKLRLEADDYLKTNLKMKTIADIRKEKNI